MQENVRTNRSTVTNQKLIHFLQAKKICTDESIVFTCPTIELISPVFSGSSTVLVDLASLLNACTYCSATAKEAALLPCYKIAHNKRQE